MEYSLERLCGDWQVEDENKMKGLEEWMIGRHQMIAEGKFQYALKERNGPRRIIAYIEGAARQDPLRGVANCELIVHGDQIVGINVEGTCAVRKGYRPTIS